MDPKQVGGHERRRYEVFVSSTFRQLENARKAVVAGVSDCRHIPVALERFAPENASDREVIKREARRCQIYILILGPLYGGVPDGETRSYTEIEYDIAEEAKRHILVFAQNWDSIIRQRKELDLSEEEHANFRNFKAFYDRATNGAHFRSYWIPDDTEALRRKVGLALATLQAGPDAPKGLVPEDDPLPDNLTIAVQNDFVRDTINAIQGFEKLYGRIQKNVDEKERAAEHFTQTYFLRLISDHTKGIFFESGSSVAFVAKQMAPKLWERAKQLDERGKPVVHISTNNVLVFLISWLKEQIPCFHFPYGPPEKTYGASLGPLEMYSEWGKPYFTQRNPIEEVVREAIEDLKTSPHALDKETTSLLIMTASGLQVSDDYTIKNRDKIDAEVVSAMEECIGPHVGSFENRLFKQYLLETGIPVAMVLDSSKIDCEIDAAHCHFLFDGDRNKWSKIYREHPMLICVGCETASVRNVARKLNEFLTGFSFTMSSLGEPYAACLGTNEQFRRQYPIA